MSLICECTIITLFESIQPLKTIPIKAHGSLNSKKERKLWKIQKSQKKADREALFQEGNRVLVSNKVELKSKKYH